MAKTAALKALEVETQGLLVGPSYNRSPLQKILQDELREVRLHDALTNVVIPAFDIKRIAPTIFSTFKIEEVPALDAKLSDICLGTSAAPTYLAPHYFENANQEFHLIDGGVSALNPGLAAISEVAQQKKANPGILPMMKDPSDFTNFVMISLGCGTEPKNATHDARKAYWWGTLRWIFGPVIEFMYGGSQDMIDYHLLTLFRTTDLEDFYLRIQDDALSEEMVKLDNSSKQNLGNLETFAKELLNKPVKRMNLNTFEFKPVPGKGTNADALKRMAKLLYDEKQNRLKGNSSN
ncbi:patatin-like protein 1 [Neltuma alba]|uniref:patatin-like protein 1 n=1 Tax=Neltuma alba TaxID=207710 RepID=UPI0010A4618B|nr:patatin-like protein 1 [Prosopis alba]